MPEKKILDNDISEKYPYVNKDNSAIVIVSYNPDQRFTKVLNASRLLSNYIIIIDNGSNNIDFIKRELHPEDILISNIQNYGIAKALNQGICKALDHKSQWIITLDQDSIPDKNLLNCYNYVLDNIKEPHNKLALIGVDYSESVKRGVNFKKKETLITSGLLHNSEIFKTVGKYNESYFIDYVDFEYSLRCNKYGYNTYIIPQKLLDHRLGEKKTKKVFGLTITSTNHSPTRRYYMVRNSIWTIKKYWFSYPKVILKKIYNLIYNIITMLLVDDFKKNKIKETLRGLRDGILNKS